MTRTCARGAIGLAVSVFLGAGALTGCANLGGLDLATVGDESTTTYVKLALNQTETHPSFVALEHFADRISDATEGRWEIEIFPNEQLGSQQEIVQFISTGAIEMAIVSGTQLENLNKDFQVLNMPTTFGSVEHQMDVIRDQELMGPLFSSLEESNNITVLGGFTQGMRSIYTKDSAVEKPEDLRGRKIRVQESDMHIRMIELMGGTATPLSYGEVYTAIQSGVLDGAENNEVSYATQKHNEVAPFWSYTNHLVGLDYMIARADLFDAMSESDREIFRREWDAAMVEHTRLWEEETRQAIETATATGATFVPADVKAFRQALAPIREEFLTTPEQNRLFEAVRARDPEAAGGDVHGVARGPRGRHGDPEAASGDRRESADTEGAR